MSVVNRETEKIISTVNKIDSEKQPVFEDDWDDDTKLYRKEFPRWLVTVVALVVLLAFISISLPNLPKIIAERFDFLSQNNLLDDDPLVVNARNAVVSITASFENPSVKQRTGTGFCISEDGWILTNLHVVKDAANLKIEFANGDVYYVKQYYPLNSYDIAVLHIPASNPPHIDLNYEFNPDEKVTIIGNPLGIKRVAAQGEIVNYYLTEDSGPIVEIDIVTKPGSSGSPVINKNGQVIAIVFATKEIEKGNAEPVTTTLALPLNIINNELRELTGKLS